MKKIINCLGASLIILLFILPNTLHSQENKQYNFIIIFTDDLGYGDLSSFGNPSIVTPVLDRMAMEGQKWTNFYVGAPCPFEFIKGKSIRVSEAKPKTLIR